MEKDILYNQFIKETKRNLSQINRIVTQVAILS